MAKANSFEAEIDEILTQFGDECQSFGAKESKYITQQPEKLIITSEAEIRRQILSVVAKDMIFPDPLYTGAYDPIVEIGVLQETYQALKNARRNGDG